jgi:6-phosphogluconolactonase
MTERELRVFDDLDGLVATAVDLFVEEKPRSIALSGGSTPKPVYERLAYLNYPWADVDVFFGDERCVPPDHPDSNFGMANEALLSKVSARVHTMYNCEAEAYEADLRAVFGDVAVPSIDLNFLGIGDDGHTASLFPGNPALDVTDRWVAYVPEPGMPPPHPRLTLTFPVHDASKLAVFLVSGEKKRERVRQLMDDADIPAARVHAQRIVVLADRAAAGWGRGS